MTADEMRQHVRALVDKAPLLSPAQRARLAAILADRNQTKTPTKS